jgi:hypothetical protein
VSKVVWRGTGAVILVMALLGIESARVELGSLWGSDDFWENGFSEKLESLA